MMFVVRIVSVIGFVVFFFFKQKTAYEMRISDWSSDVCSSDLPVELLIGFEQFLPVGCKIVRHAIEGTAQGSNLIALRPFGNTDLEIARTDLLGRRDQRADRP